MCALFDLAALV